MNIENISVEVRGILKNAAEWRLIALMLERPRQHTLPQIGCIAEEIHDEYLKEIADLTCKATEETYLQYFGPGGMRSPREVAYIGWADPGKMLSEIGLLYESFSFAPRSEDPYDHMAVEADFVSYLYIKEAYAVVNEDLLNAATVEAVRRKFIEEHLGVLITGLRRKLNGSEPIYFLKTLIAILMRLKPYSMQSVRTMAPPAEWAGCEAPIL